MSRKEFALNRYENEIYCGFWNMADKTQNVILVGEIEFEGCQRKYDTMTAQFWLQIWDC